MTRRLVRIELSRGRGIAGDKVVHGIFSDQDPGLARLGADGAHAAKSLAQALRFAGEAERTAEIPLGAKGRTLTLVGLGKSTEFTVERANAFVEQAIEVARSSQAASLGLVLPEHEQFWGEAAAERVTRRLALADYRFDSYLSAPPRAAGARLKAVAVAVPAAWRRAWSPERLSAARSPKAWRWRAISATRRRTRPRPSGSPARRAAMPGAGERRSGCSPSRSSSAGRWAPSSPSVPDRRILPAWCASIWASAGPSSRWSARA